WEWKLRQQKTDIIGLTQGPEDSRQFLEATKPLVDGRSSEDNGFLEVPTNCRHVPTVPYPPKGISYLCPASYFVRVASSQRRFEQVQVAVRAKCSGGSKTGDQRLLYVVRYAMKRGDGSSAPGS